MEFIAWDKKYELNILEIDTQHKSLFSLINRLHLNLIEAAAPSEIKSILDELVRYTQVHFHFEEKFFSRINFEDEDEVELHKDEHLNFCKQVEQFQKKLSKGEEKLTSSIMDFLKDWLSNHILKTDMNMRDEYLKNGFHK